MSAEDPFSHFFKPEVRHAADELLKKKSVFLKLGSDTQIEGSVRGTTLLRVTFRAASIESETFLVDCSCPASKKGQFCKHVWAVLVLARVKSPDFFESKTAIEKDDLLKSKTSPARAADPEFAERQANLKNKQADYRKQAYQAQKQRAKNLKSDRAAREQRESIKTSAFSLNLPEDVKAAFAYFEVNGFALTLPVDEITLNNAKRVLSRVFHPDKGGSHAEMIELLKQSNVLLKFRL